VAKSPIRRLIEQTGQRAKSGLARARRIRHRLEQYCAGRFTVLGSPQTVQAIV
jgi:hypothetical protein